MIVTLKQQLFPHQLSNTEAVRSLQFGDQVLALRLGFSFYFLRWNEDLLELQLLRLAHVDKFLILGLVTVDLELGRTGWLVRQRLQAVCYLQQLFRLDISVGLQVSLQVGALVETALTYWTSMWSLLVVKYFVNCQGPRLTESFPAVRAFKWFLFGMNVAVIPGIERLNN